MSIGALLAAIGGGMTGLGDARMQQQKLDEERKWRMAQAKLDFDRQQRDDARFVWQQDQAQQAQNRQRAQDILDQVPYQGQLTDQEVRDLDKAGLGGRVQKPALPGLPFKAGMGAGAPLEAPRPTLIPTEGQRMAHEQSRIMRETNEARQREVAARKAFTDLVKANPTDFNAQYAFIAENDLPETLMERNPAYRQFQEAKEMERQKAVAAYSAGLIRNRTDPLDKELSRAQKLVALLNLQTGVQLGKDWSERPIRDEDGPVVNALNRALNEIDVRNAQQKAQDYIKQRGLLRAEDPPLVEALDASRNADRSIRLNAFLEKLGATTPDGVRNVQKLLRDTRYLIEAARWGLSEADLLAELQAREKSAVGAQPTIPHDPVAFTRYPKVF